MSAKQMSGLEKRKACDSCHSRKIKCDAKKPSCSQCIMYEKECLFSPFIIRSVITRQRKRIARLENNKSRPSPVPHSSENGRPSPSPTSRSLPSLSEILPLIDHYFSNLNVMIPLFNSQRFRERLYEWDQDRYSGNHAITQASIYIILGLCFKNKATKRTLPWFDSIDNMKMVQLLVSEIMIQRQDMRALEVLLGLALLFQRQPDPQPSLLYIAAAVQLTHRLRLHEQTLHESKLDSAEAMERNRLFWIMYILDKDINVRCSMPYMHQDGDTSVLPPPALASSETIGVIQDRDGRLVLSLLAARFHLARVQGRLYDWTQSVEYRGKSRLQRQPQMDRLRKILKGWEEALPQDYSTLEFSARLSECSRRQMIVLRFDHAYLLFQMYGVFLHDAEWVELLNEFSRSSLVQGFETPCFRTLASQDWQEVRQTSREISRLLALIDREDDDLIQSSSCTYVSAMIILIVNKLVAPDDELEAQRGGDDELIIQALAYFDRAAKTSGLPQYMDLYNASWEMNHRADELRLLRRMNGSSEVKELVECPSYTSTIDLPRAFREASVKPLTI